MINELENSITSCNLCPRLREVTPIPYPHIMYCEPKDVKLMLIGRNPGIEDDYSGVSIDGFKEIYHKRWWECRVGKYVRQRLGDDFVEKHVFFTNVVKCSSPNNSIIRMPEKHRCYPFLKQQIDVIRPNVIVTISGDSKDMLQQDMKDHKYNGTPVFHMYHPSYFRYTSDKTKSKKQDVLFENLREKLS